MHAKGNHLSKHLTPYIAATALILPLLAIFSASTAKAQKLTVQTVDYPTLGNPTSAIETADGRYVFVSVTNVGAPNFKGPDSAAGERKDVVSGIQVFRLLQHKLTPVGFVRTGSAGANGLVLLRGGKTLAVGVGDEGVAFLNVQDVLKGKAAPITVSQGARAGTFDLVATPDGRFVFTANEYGVIDGQRGNVGVIDTGIDVEGKVSVPKTIRQIPVGDVVPSLTLSHDRKHLYVATELLPSNTSVSIGGSANPSLTKNDCVQSKATPARSNGYISIIDVQLATDISANQEAVIARTAAGCSPVRLAETSNGSTLFVSARGDNVVLEYNAALLASDPEHAFRRAIPSGGEAPVGLRLFDHDRLLAVADSNRFADGSGKLAIFDIADTPPKLLETLPSGLFPRNLSEADASGRIFLTNYSSRSVTIIN